MIHITESITVRQNIHNVFRYVSDFSNIEQWDPGVIKSQKMTPGPVRPGSKFKLKCKFLCFTFSMNYRVTGMEPPNSVVFEGRGKKFSAKDSISFKETGNGTRIEYSLNLEFKEVSFPIEKFISFYIKRIGKASIRGLAHAFEGNYTLPKIELIDRWMDKSILPGMLTFSKYGYHWRKRSWNPLAVFLTEQTVLVTGATSGIGKITALKIARLGAKTIIVGRNSQKVDSVCREIIEETGNTRIQGEVADLSIKADIRSLADKMDRKEPNIHVLINNAGALYNYREETVDGIERTLALNLMGPFLLTTLLLPKLKSSAPSRIINISSGGMYTHKPEVHDLEYKKEPFNGENAYARAKRGLVIITKTWAEKYKEDGIVVHAMHPGWVATPGIQKSLPRFYKLTKSILRTPEQGADTIVWLAAAREVSGTTGAFWFDRRPHIVDVFPGTRSTPNECAQLLKELERISEIEVAE
jgi:dehydrogenase/reductase SDR family protein 12